MFDVALMLLRSDSCRLCVVYYSRVDYFIRECRVMKLACVVILAALLLCECVAVKHQSKLSSKKSTSRRSLDDDDDDSPSVSSKRTKGKATPKAPLKRMGGKSQLVKWGDKKKEKSRSGRGAAGTSLKERLESIASQSTNAYKNAFRQVKVHECLGRILVSRLYYL
jgi:hypothetical protein